MPKILPSLYMYKSQNSFCVTFTALMFLQAKRSGALTASCVLNRLPNPAKFLWLGWLTPLVLRLEFPPPAPQTSQTLPVSLPDWLHLHRSPDV